MGAFCGSLHVRAADASTVLPHVERIAKAKRGSFLVAPSIGGWVAVYPEDGAQDQRIGAALAKRVGGDVIWISLHDDDVFAYAVWKDGKRLDEYNSCPDYFETASASRRKRTAGNPAAFAEILPAGVTPDSVKHDLSGDATRQLEAFSRHLGLANVLTSYDYLMGGQTENLPEFDRFVHVPDRTAELESRRRKDVEIAAELDRLRSAGVLRCDIPLSDPQPMAPFPAVTAAPGEGEFLYTLSDFITPTGERDLFRLVPPYSAGPKTSGIRLDSTVYKLCVSPSGKYLAVGKPAAELWDLAAQTLVHRLPEAGSIEFVGFSGNEAELLCLSEGSLTVLDIERGSSREIRCPRNSRTVCLHPFDNIFVSTDGGAALVLIDAASAREVRRLVYPSFGGNEVFRLRFTSDGTRLVCAAFLSLRIYDWEAIRTATVALPPPLFSIAPETFEYEFQRQRFVSTGPVYDAIDVPSKGIVVFSENSGAIRALKLDTGEVRPLVRPPVQGPIWGDLQLSRDQTSIAFAYRPTHEDAGDPTPYRIQIWDLERALSG